jgi:hypothetical protein
VFFGINLSGSGLAGQHGREITVGDGDAGITPSDARRSV